MTDIWQAGKTYVPGALVKPSSTTTVAQPQPTNGNFSTGDLTGWAQAGSRFAIATDTPYSGTYFVRCSGSGVESLNNTNRVPVSPGQRITAKAAAKLTNNGTDDQGAQVIIVWLNAADAEIGTALGSLISGVGGSWKITTASGVAPPLTASAFTRLNASNGTHGGTVEFDDVSWDYAYQAPPPGLIFKATQAAPGKSGSTEPTWPTSTGIPVTDNQVTWEGVIASRVVWEASPIMKTGDTEPTWPLVAGAVVHDGNMDWIAVSSRITDPKCPNSKVVAIMASKVFAADRDIVRFSATVNPLDWTSSQDAGYLPTGLQQANSNDMAVLAPYRSNLTAFNASSFQNWQVDPDPSAMSMLDQMEGIGSSWQHAAQPVGNDLFYLSQLGVRSVGIAAGTDNLSAGDIGMPVDVLVQEAIRIAQANGSSVLATYYPGAGQYWLAFSENPPDTLSLTGNLPNGTVGASVSYQYGSQGGLPPVTYAIASGALPPGLSMSSSGLVTGTMTTVRADAYSWLVRGTDSLGNPADLPDSATVSYTTLALSGTFPGATIGVAYDQYITISGGDGNYSLTGGTGVSAGSLPAGLSLSIKNTDELHLSGTPTGSAGTASFTDSVDSGDGQTATSAQSVNVTKLDFRTVILSQSPVSYWRLGEASAATVAVDEMGNNNLTYGAAGITKGSTSLLTGDSNTAVTSTMLGLIGSKAAASAALLSADLSFMAVVKFTTTAREAMIHIGDRSVNLQQGVSFGTNGSTVILEYISAAGGFRSVSSASGLITAGSKYILAGSITAAGDINLYLNGAKVASGNGGAARIVPTTGPVSLGGLTGDATQWVNGVQDDTAVWNRILTDAEFAAQAAAA